MVLTFGNYAAILCIALFIAFAGFLFCLACSIEVKRGLISTGVTAFIVCFLTALCCSWFNTHTASGIRAVKDYHSELTNGINREIVITAEDGREIFHYEGKVDIEADHTDNYILFESEDGRRYIIYYGIQDTVLIIEK